MTDFSYCNICGGTRFRGQFYIGDFNGRICQGHSNELGTTQEIVFQDILGRLTRIENILTGLKPVEKKD